MPDEISLVLREERAGRARLTHNSFLSTARPHSKAMPDSQLRRARAKGSIQKWRLRESRVLFHQNISRPLQTDLASQLAITYFRLPWPESVPY